MKTIKITRDFVGVRSWPKEGVPETYTIGQVVTVPNAFADRVVEKGQAQEVEPDTDAGEATSETPRAAAKRGEEASEAKRNSRRSD